MVVLTWRWLAEREERHALTCCRINTQTFGSLPKKSLPLSPRSLTVALSLSLSLSLRISTLRLLYFTIFPAHCYLVTWLAFLLLSFDFNIPLPFLLLVSSFCPSFSLSFSPSLSLHDCAEFLLEGAQSNQMCGESGQMVWVEEFRNEWRRMIRYREGEKRS